MDEVGECAIYDATTSKERVEIAKKKIRKVFCGRPIYVRFKLRNPLLTNVEISNLKLVAEGVRYTGNVHALSFTGKDETDITLKVVPEETGDIQITKIEWELLGIFKCEYQLSGGTKISHSLLQEREKIF